MNLERVRIVQKVAELASFTRAAEQLGMPKSRVSTEVKALEEELGRRLLQRSTRAVRTTPDGERFLGRAEVLLAEADRISSMFRQTSGVKGRVRIDLPIHFAYDHVIPRLPELMAKHPDLELFLSTTDRRVDLVREGFDCVLRIGTLKEPGLTARRLGHFSMLNCASPSYVARYGVPRSPRDLVHHRLVHYSLSLGGDEPSFEYKYGSRFISVPMKAPVTVNGTHAFQAACLAGLGIIQAPRIGTERLIERGLLVELLPLHTAQPMPVSLVHRHGRDVSPPVRAVMAWLEGVARSVLV